MVEDAVGEFRVIGEVRGFYMPVVEDSVEELALRIRERENYAQGGAGFFHHLVCPAFRVVHCSEMIRSQDGDERAAKFVRLEADVFR